MEMVYIRVDMNPIIATGHVFRCLAIADKIKANKRQVKFIVADEYPLKLLKQRGYEAVVLHTPWNRMEEELPVLLKWIRKERIGKLLVDSYQVTPRYLEALQKETDVIYMDDLNLFPYPVSGVICYAGYYHRFSYKIGESQTRYYLGTDYVPLRSCYENCPAKEIKERIQTILILSGGTDSFHLIENVVELFKEEPGITLEVVCGAFYKDYEQIKARYSGCSNIVFSRNISNLEEKMKKADLAVCAGGTTLYELCAMGTPTISYSFADNQLYNVKQFEEDGLMDYAGDVRNTDIYRRIKELYHFYDKNPQLRRERSLRMQQLVDGRGAGRIAALLQAHAFQ